MQRSMFSKFSTLIQQAVDSFSPDITLLEEFVYHWKAVTSYFVNCKDERCPIEQTQIPAHIEQMMRILSEEEEQSNESGTTGPCLEYVLQHKLMETLYTLGRTDHPPGMKQIVLIFFTKLLSRIKHPLLPHINVHRAVQRLVKTCGETQAAPSEKEEIEYLCTVCSKIKTDPYLINFFIEVPGKMSQNRGSKVSDQTTIQTKLSAGTHDFSLVKALLSLSHSEDARVAVKSCEGLMLCASLPTQSAAQCICDNTNFCDDIAGRLCQLYDALPTVISPTDIDTVSAKWGLDVITEREDHQSFRGKRTLTSFISWLDYCDQLIAMANPLVACALAKTIHKKLLTGKIQPSILQTCETSAIIATAYLSRCLKTVCSAPLLSEFCYFILGQNSKPETREGDSHLLRRVLVERCNHLSEEVCVITLKLFDTLLQKEDEFILHNLVLRNLLGRSYLNPEYLDMMSTSSSLTDTNVNHNVLSATPSAVTANKPLDDGQDTKTEIHHQMSSGEELEKSNKSENDIASLDNKLNMSAAEISLSDSKMSASEIKLSTSDNTTTEPDIKLSTSDSTTTEPDTKLSTSDSTTSEPDTKLSKSDTKMAVSDDTVSSSDSKISPSDIRTSSVDSTEKDDQSEEKQSCVQTSQSESGASGSAVGQNDDVTRKEDLTTAALMSSSSTVLFCSPLFQPEIHRVVNSFLSVLPEEAKSSYQTADGGYDMYLRDANKQFSIVESGCKNWNWPKHVVQLAEYDMKMFYEGSFLKMLFDRLTRLLDQTYAVNLLLTSVISQIVLMPHPNLHEFFLNPFVPVKDNVRTLFSVLTKVSSEIKAYMKNERQFSEKLIFTRKQLLSMSQTLSSLRMSDSQRDWFDDQTQMEAIIVLEEFCKELSAIAFVKHHAAVINS